MAARPKPGPLLRSTDGSVTPLHVGAWRAEADEVERSLIDELPAPLLDVGCGPGRIVAAAAAQGRPALGIDTAPSARDETVRRGAAVLTRSVFDPLPGEGRWRSVVLFDGNIGIGGSPNALLARVRELLHRCGVVLVEVAPPGAGSVAATVRVERHARAGVQHGPWFPWARVDADDIEATLARAGFESITFCRGGRWFARGELS